jgi:hypothetical protein
MRPIISYIQSKKYADSKTATINANVTKGSPSGVYATVSALQTAKPTGDGNIYLVSADGKWYYWSGSAWTAGGVYQGTGPASVATSAGVSSLANGLLHNEGPGATITYEGNSKVRIKYASGVATGNIYIARIALCKVGDLVNRRVYLKTQDDNTADATNNTNGYRIGFSCVDGQQWGLDKYNILFTDYLTGKIVDGKAIRDSLIAGGYTDADTVYVALNNGADYTTQTSKSNNKTMQVYLMDIADGVINATSIGKYKESDIATIETNASKQTVVDGTALPITTYAGSDSKFNVFTKTTSGLTTTITRPATDNSTLLWNYLAFSADLGTLADIKNKKFFIHLDHTNSDLKIQGQLLLSKQQSAWGPVSINGPVYDFSSYYVVGSNFYDLVKANGNWLDTDHVYLMFKQEQAANSGPTTIPALNIDISVLSVAKEAVTDKKTQFKVADALTNFVPADYAKKTDIANAVPGSYITCWGDSLTAQGGWTDQLATLSGLPLYNGGTGGENVRTITARQGADVMLINNVTIPADTSAVVLKRYSDNGFDTAFGYKSTPLLQGGAHVNPVMIGDVQGTLTWTGSSYSDTSGTWTFARTTAGTAVTIDRPTAIRTNFDRTYNNGIMVMFMGQNGGYTDNADLVNMHKLVIDHFKGKEYLILGMHTGDATSRADYESQMKTAFGRRFFSLRQYLTGQIKDSNGNITSCYGLADAGLTPTAQDLTDIAAGKVPQQLLADGVHFTSATKTLIGNAIYKKMKELNIL